LRRERQRGHEHGEYRFVDGFVGLHGLNRLYGVHGLNRLVGIDRLRVHRVQWSVRLERFIRIVRFLGLLRRIIRFLGWLLRLRGLYRHNVHRGRRGLLAHQRQPHPGRQQRHRAHGRRQLVRLRDH
jgi:hypothetical protein